MIKVLFLVLGLFSTTSYSMEYPELSCADLLTVHEFLDESRIIQPHPAVVENRILQGIKRHLEITGTTLSQRAIHVLGQRLLRADPQISSQLVIERFFKELAASFRGGSNIEDEIDWTEKEVTFEIQKSKFEHYPNPESEIKRWIGFASHRLGASGTLTKLDLKNWTATFLANPNFIDILKYTGGFELLR